MLAGLCQVRGPHRLELTVAPAKPWQPPGQAGSGTTLFTSIVRPGASTRSDYARDSKDFGPWQQRTNLWRGLTSLPHRLTRPTSEEALPAARRNSVRRRIWRD